MSQFYTDTKTNANLGRRIADLISSAITRRREVATGADPNHFRPE